MASQSTNGQTDQTAVDVLTLAAIDTIAFIVLGLHVLFLGPSVQF